MKIKIIRYLLSECGLKAQKINIYIYIRYKFFIKEANNSTVNESK